MSPFLKKLSTWKRNTIQIFGLLKLLNYLMSPDIFWENTVFVSEIWLENFFKDAKQIFNCIDLENWYSKRIFFKIFIKILIAPHKKQSWNWFSKKKLLHRDLQSNNLNNSFLKNADCKCIYQSLVTLSAYLHKMQTGNVFTKVW